jgi:hypothetical protein
MAGLYRGHVQMTTEEGNEASKRKDAKCQNCFAFDRKGTSKRPATYTETQSLSTTGLGNTNNVLPIKQSRPGASLDRRRLSKLLEGRGDPLVDRKGRQIEQGVVRVGEGNVVLGEIGLGSRSEGGVGGEVRSRDNGRRNGGG